MKKHVTQTVVTFFLPPNTFPNTSNHSVLFTHQYPKFLAFGEVDLRLVLLTPHLTDFQVNLFSAANLDISPFGLLCVGQTSLV